MGDTTYNTKFEWNDYKSLLGTLKHTPSSEIDNTTDGIETLLIGKVRLIKIRSAKSKGVIIENNHGVVHLVDPSGESEILLFSEKLKQLQKMNLDELVVFKVKITDDTIWDKPVKMISLIDIMTLDKAKDNIDI